MEAGPRRKFGVKYYLHHAGTVAQIQENDAAVVAAAANPAGQGYLGISVFQAQVAAVGATKHAEPPILVSSGKGKGLSARENAQYVLEWAFHLATDAGNGFGNSLGGADRGQAERI